MCVSGYRPSLILGHDLNFFIVVFGFFYNRFFSQKNVFSVKSILLHLILKITLQKVFCNVDDTWAEIKLRLAIENEEATSHDTTWQTEKCRYSSSVFYKKYLR